MKGPFLNEIYVCFACVPCERLEIDMWCDGHDLATENDHLNFRLAISRYTL